jgi:hypothetical protein
MACWITDEHIVMSSDKSTVSGRPCKSCIEKLNNKKHYFKVLVTFIANEK